MRSEKEIEAFRAELIAKLFLYGTGFTEVFPDMDKHYDFIAQAKPGKRLGIEVKQTRSSRADILKKFATLRNSFTANGMPVVLFYINSDKEDGYFEIIGKKVHTDVLPLRKDLFLEKINAALN